MIINFRYGGEIIIHRLAMIDSRNFQMSCSTAVFYTRNNIWDRSLYIHWLSNESTCLILDPLPKNAFKLFHAVKCSWILVMETPRKHQRRVFVSPRVHYKIMFMANSSVPGKYFITICGLVGFKVFIDLFYTTSFLVLKYPTMPLCLRTTYMGYVFRQLPLFLVIHHFVENSAMPLFLQLPVVSVAVNCKPVNYYIYNNSLRSYLP